MRACLSAPPAPRYPRSTLPMTALTHGDTSFTIQDAIVTLRGRAAWAHNFDTNRSVSTFFRTLPASSFVVNGAAQARDAALATVGAEGRWQNGFSVAATFEVKFSNTTES